MNDKLNIICRYIFNKKPNTTNLVLQKLLYFIQAYVLVSTDGKELAFSENMEAWMYGPVIPEVYRNLKSDNNFYRNFSKNDDEFLKHNPLIKEAVSTVVDGLGELNPYTLVNLTHSYAPWKEAWESSVDNAVISQNKIAEFHIEKNKKDGNMI